MVLCFLTGFLPDVDYVFCYYTPGIYVKGYMVFISVHSVISFIRSLYHHFRRNLRWLGEAKVSSIWHQRGIQLILAYSWARPAILAAGKGRGGMFLFLRFFTFIHFPLSPLSLSLISSTSLLPFSGRWHKMTHKG